MLFRRGCPGLIGRNNEMKPMTPGEGITRRRIRPSGGLHVSAATLRRSGKIFGTDVLFRQRASRLRASDRGLSVTFEAQGVLACCGACSLMLRGVAACNVRGEAGAARSAFSTTVLHPAFRSVQALRV